MCVCTCSPQLSKQIARLQRHSKIVLKLLADIPQSNCSLYTLPTACKALHIRCCVLQEQLRFICTELYSLPEQEAVCNRLRDICVEVTLQHAG